jgi:hypothetical protein
MHAYINRSHLLLPNMQIADNKHNSHADVVSKNMMQMKISKVDICVLRMQILQIIASAFSCTPLIGIAM